MKRYARVDCATLHLLVSVYFAVQNVKFSCVGLSSATFMTSSPPEIWLSKYLKVEAYSTNPPQCDFNNQFQFDSGPIARNGGDYFVDGQDINIILNF